MARVNFVTRDMIRAIKPMDMEVFELPTTQACESARMQVSHVKRIDGGEYKCHVDYQEKKVAVKRLS